MAETQLIERARRILNEIAAKMPMPPMPMMPHTTRTYWDEKRGCVIVETIDQADILAANEPRP